MRFQYEVKIPRDIKEARSAIEQVQPEFGRLGHKHDKSSRDREEKLLELSAIDSDLNDVGVQTESLAQKVSKLQGIVNHGVELTRCIRWVLYHDNVLKFDDENRPDMVPAFLYWLTTQQSNNTFFNLQNRRRFFASLKQRIFYKAAILHFVNPVGCCRTEPIVSSTHSRP